MLQFDALALTDCPGMILSMMLRCLHWGPIIYACCVMRECSMPIVPVEVLIGLFRADSRLGEEELEAKGRISDWLNECVTQNRFCPTGDGQFNEYISSKGNQDGTVDEEGFLRTSGLRWKDRSDKMSVFNLLASNIFRRHCAELWHSFSISEESLACALYDMAAEFTMDIQRLLGVNMFEMERHTQFFGIKDLLCFSFLDRAGEHPFASLGVWLQVLFKFWVVESGCAGQGCFEWGMASTGCSCSS